MTKEELKNLYPEGEVFPNQYELGMFICKYGNAHDIKGISNNWKYPPADTDVYYDIAEIALQKSMAFSNDNFWILEDLDYLKEFV